MTSASIEPTDIPAVPYFLVLLVPQDDREVEPAVFTDHVAFIEHMASEGIVLLGGGFETPIEGASAAYLLHTASKAEAEAWAARDPLMTSGAYRATVIAWHLVGIAPNAIDPTLTA